MSMRSFFDTGYGSKVNEIEFKNAVKYAVNHADTVNKICNTNIEGFKKLLEKHKDTGLEDYELSEEDVELFNDEDKDEWEEIIKGADSRADDVGYELFDIMMELIKAVINEEEGYQVIYAPGQPDIDSEPAIILPAGEPWSFNKKEKEMTKEEFEESFGEHMEELGLKKEDIDYQEIEYYG